MPKNFSTGYNIMFAAAVCVFWSILVSASAVVLKDRQDENIRFDKQRNILYAAGLADPGADNKRADLVKNYKENIRAYVIDRETGEVNEDVDPGMFDQRIAATDRKQSESAPANDAKVARVPNNALVYHVVEGEKVTSLVLPVTGGAMWSTVYGFLALDADTRTVTGVSFYEHQETPGLGAEIENPNWTETWKGRQVLNEAFLPAFGVQKGGAGSVEEDPHNVDSLTGATITSVAVANLINFWLGEQGYGPYLAKFRGGK